MVDRDTKVSASASCQIYRSMEIRPKILMRADSEPATFFPSTASMVNCDGGERVFRVS